MELAMGTRKLSSYKPESESAGVAVRILPLSGRLTFGRHSDARYGELCACLQQGARTVVLDLTGVPDVDSAGVGFLVACLMAARRAGADLRLAAPTNRVLYVLLITRLDTVFPVFESVEAALG